jgi:hypothetical protein
MKTPEDEAFDEIEKAQGWRKRQIQNLVPKTADEFYAEMRDMILEEVALEFDKMKGGDTSASFAAYVRRMKR